MIMTKLIIAGFVGFIISMGGGMVFHGGVLHDDYAQIPNLMRTDADAMGYLPFMIASHLIKGFAFAWVYRQGVSDGSWITQGIRFGIAMALLITVPLYLVYYAVQPLPGMLVVKQITFDTIGTVLMAIAIAFILKPSTATPS